MTPCALVSSYSSALLILMFVICTNVQVNEHLLAPGGEGVCLLDMPDTRLYANSWVQLLLVIQDTVNS